MRGGGDDRGRGDDRERRERERERRIDWIGTYTSRFARWIEIVWSPS